jgi:hypothetical protein
MVEQGAHLGARKESTTRRESAAWTQKSLAGVTGLEPATSAVTGQRSEPIELHPQIGGKSNVMVGAKGLEPLTPSV